jgi:hypothetical protein
LSYGQTYTLSAPGVQDLFGNKGNATAQFKTTILIDGNFDDWTGVAVAASDEEGDSSTGFDLKEIYVANDADNLYFLVKIYESSTTADFNTGPYQLFVDADGDATTGNTWSFTGLGSEMCLQFGAGWGGAFSQKNGGWDNGALSDVGWAETPTGVLPTYQFEFKLSRSVRYADGSPVITTNVITIGTRSLNSGWSAQDDIPAFSYTLPVNPTHINVSRVGNKMQLNWDGGGELQYRDSVNSGEWTPVADATTGIQIDTTNATRFYRVKQ